jgi:hypothetical protein
VGGLIPHLVDGGVSILQYADDTVIYMEHDLAKARNMKLVLRVNVYVQCTLIWKYIKCMRILFTCYYVISTIFGMKLTAR